MVTYSEEGKYAYFNGYTFTRDEKTGYYLSAKSTKNNKRQRLHVYVWGYYNGEVPKGYEIHHKDEDKSNNELDNFELVTGLRHRRIHADEFLKDEKRIEQSRYYLLNKAQPKAMEWHGSEAGREWHKKHYDEFKDKLHVTHEYNCRYCGKKFISIKEGFCSNNCKSAWRRKEGLDNISRKCIICGSEFITNKYSKVLSCSMKCRGALRCLNKQNKLKSKT